MKKLAPIAGLALLAACGGDRAPDDQAREATGEVLEGTISDAMLPVDRVRSQPPLEEPAARSTAGAQPQAAAGEGPPGDAPDEEPQAEADED